MTTFEAWRRSLLAALGGDASGGTDGVAPLGLEREDGTP